MKEEINFIVAADRVRQGLIYRGSLRSESKKLAIIYIKYNYI